MILSTPSKFLKEQSNPSSLSSALLSDDTSQSSGDGELLTSFAQLDIDFGVNSNELINRHSKRSMDLMTVEGSPMITSKRMDSQPTPVSFKHLQNIPSYNMPLQSNTQFQPKLQSADQQTYIQPDFNTTTQNSTNVIQRPDARPVAIFNASDSDSHDTGCHHQENSLRTSLINGPEGCLKRQPLKQHVHHMDADLNGEASLVDLLRVHEYTYLNHLEKMCARLKVQNTSKSSSAATDMPYFYAPAGMLDSDTPLSSQSLHAAKTFCGAAIAAIDLVMNNADHSSGGIDDNDDNTSYCRAFVVGRPPGHHAGPMGCVVSEHHWRRPDMSSSGFCLLNTVAVAAAYARYNYSRPHHRMLQRTAASAVAAPIKSCNTNSITSSITSNDDVKSSSASTATSSSVEAATRHKSSTGLRIAIVDIDVHHGNGTEEIVRHLTPHTRYLPLPSSYAPVGQFAYKPWLNEHDAEDTIFASVHLFAGDNSGSGSDGGDSSSFYPGTGREEEIRTTIPSPNHNHAGDDKNDHQNTNNNKNNKNIVNICLTPIGPTPGDSKARARLSLKQRTQLHDIASREMKHKVETILLPRLKSFQADLLLISAGFDAHGDDLYHFLDEQDFHWLTARLCDCVISASGSGRVVSVLEGGYSLSPPVVSNSSVTSSLSPPLGTTRQQSSRQQQQQQGIKTSSSSVIVHPLPSESDQRSNNTTTTEAVSEPDAPDSSNSSISNANDNINNNNNNSHHCNKNNNSRVSKNNQRKCINSIMHTTAAGVYAQTVEDGGLVKSVLAHVAALAGVTDWLPQRQRL